MTRYPEPRLPDPGRNPELSRLVANDYVRAYGDVLAVQAGWCDWLAATGYGIDFGSTVPPPCTVTELAEAWQRREPLTADDGDPVQQYEECITASFDPWSGP